MPPPPPPPYCATAKLEMPTISAGASVDLRTLFNINSVLLFCSFVRSVIWIHAGSQGELHRPRSNHFFPLRLSISSALEYGVLREYGSLDILESMRRPSRPAIYRRSPSVLRTAF